MCLKETLIITILLSFSDLSSRLRQFSFPVVVFGILFSLEFIVKIRLVSVGGFLTSSFSSESILDDADEMSALISAKKCKKLFDILLP